MGFFFVLGVIKLEIEFRDMGYGLWVMSYGVMG